MLVTNFWLSFCDMCTRLSQKLITSYILSKNQKFLVLWNLTSRSSAYKGTQSWNSVLYISPPKVSGVKLARTFHIIFSKKSWCLLCSHSHSWHSHRNYSLLLFQRAHAWNNIHTLWIVWNETVRNKQACISCEVNSQRDLTFCCLFRTRRTIFILDKFKQKHVTQYLFIFRYLRQFFPFRLNNWWLGSGPWVNYGVGENI
jgi:hypothetical protein